MAEVRRLCEGCGKRRAERFFPEDRRRTSGKSDTCVTCKRGKRRTQSKNQRLQETYDITEAEWHAILAAQNGGKGGCAICGGHRPTYDVDHDHKLEKAGVPIRETLRGLTCKRCNRRLLPACLDDTLILMRAIAYLEAPPAQAILAKRSAAEKVTKDAEHPVTEMPSL